MVREAERIVASVTPLAADTTCKLAEAADKAAKADKFREDMQAALRARFKNPNITVI
jgi:hypothetical protein